MNKLGTSRTGTLIAATAIAAVLCLGGCGSAASSGAKPVASAPAVLTPAPASSLPAMTMAPESMAGMIHIESGTYRDAAPVAAGSMVTVMNMDDAAYTVTAENGSFSVTVPAGAMATFKAPDKAGNYPFHSDGRSGMHGNLTVR
jgi:plastocyanin